MLGGTVLLTMHYVTCCHVGCGLVFGIEEGYVRELKRTHCNFYCPNGHDQHWPQKTPEQRRIEELENTQRQILAQRDRAYNDLSSERKAHTRTRHRHAAVKGVLTKTKKRIANGVCPCCHRTFVNLGKHMKGQHPNYTKEKADEG